MKRFALLSGLLAMTLVAQAAGVLRQRHDIPAITQVVIETPGDLEIRPGAQASLTIEAEQKTLDALDFVIDGETLFLRNKGGFSTQQGLRYLIVVPKLQSFSSRSSGNSTVGAFHGERLDVEIGGSGDVTLTGIKARRLNLRVSGSGNIEAGGGGDALRAEISGSGGIRAEGYAVARAETRIDGSGEILVRASKELEAVIRGAGSIRYAGKPAVTQVISGAGSVDPL